MIVLMTTVGLVGCGSTAQDGNTYKFAPGDRGSIQACLEEAGAELATTGKDLRFLAVAEANEAVSRPALAYDGKADVVIHIWTGVIRSNQPPDWMLWYGLPFGMTLGPWEIVDERPVKSFVLYVKQGSAKVMQKTRKCIKFNEAEEREKPALHRVTK